MTLSQGLWAAARKVALPTAAVALAASFVGCNSHEVTPFAENIKAEQSDNFISAGASKVDILWVVDNSGSMCEEQQSLRDNFDRFVDALGAIGADFHLAVVTTDMVDPEESGRFQNVPDGEAGPSCDLTVDISECPSPANGGEFPSLVLKSADYQTPEGDLDIARLKRDFGCNATTGTKGNGFEMGLESAKVALSPALLGGFNSGFLRDDAFLSIVFLTDENDCSDRGALNKVNGNVCEWEEDKLVPSQEYIDFFTQLKGGDPNRVIMAGIIAPDPGIRYMPGQEVQPSCFSDFGGDGFAGYRYNEVIEAFPTSSIANICEPPFNDALEAISELIVQALDVACLSAIPVTCESAADCAGDQTCGSRGAGERQFCSGFTVQVEVRRPTPLDARECEELANTNGQQSCLLQEGVDFTINYAEPECGSGMGIDLVYEPGADDSLIIRYPRAVDISAPEEAPEPEAGQ